MSIVGVLQTFKQLLAYLLVTTLLISPAGWYFIALAFFIRDGNYAWRVWIMIDRLACTTIHGTLRRTISGYTGQFMHRKKRYYYQAKVIDFLARCVGDTPNHCYRAYLWEQRKGYIE